MSIASWMGSVAELTAVFSARCCLRCKTTDMELKHHLVSLFISQLLLVVIYHLITHLHAEGWTGWVDLGGWLHTEIFYPPHRWLLISVLIGPNCID